MDTVVITGASRGIGRAVAADFANAGAHIVVCSRSADDSAAVADDIAADGGEATAVRADIRDEYDAERLLETAARVGGGTVDCVVANAAVYHGDPGETPLAETSYAAFDDTLRTNARGVFATIREAVPHLAADGRVLVPSGRVAREATAGVGSYAVSKAAAEAIARQFAAELDATVGVVDLGRVDTDLTNNGGGRSPESVAPMVRWAAAEADPEAVDGAVVGLADWKRATA